MKSKIDTALTGIGLLAVLAICIWQLDVRNECIDRGGVYITSQWVCIKAEVM